MTENNGAEKSGKTNGPAAAGTGTGQPPVQVNVVAQYVRDFSFENPSVDKLIDGLGETPKLELEVNVGAGAKRENLYESAINFKAVAANNIGTIYDLEIIYAGLFRLQGIPDDALEPFLLINCPMMLFPFLRRLVADITREGGFPPLLLDPIDFAGLYMNRKKEMAAGELVKPKA